MASTNFAIQSGEPFPAEGVQRIRVTFPVDRDYWLDTDEFEVLMQVRAGAAETSELKADLAQYLTVSMDVLDILIDWSMTGAETRTLVGGHYDMVISDPGTTDGRAKRILAGRISVAPIVTAAASV